MTTSEFLRLHNSQLASANKNTISNQTQINVNFDTDPGDPSGGIITGVTVTTTTKKDWDNPLTATNTVNLINALQQVQTIRFEISNQKFRLDIQEKTRYIDSNNSSYDNFFFAVTPFKFKPAQSGYVNIKVFFEPLVLGETFTYNDYNPIINNVVEGRASTVRQESDRQGFGIVSTGAIFRPVNYLAILNRTANPAQVQDSNYTTTGWINSRYVGSKTTAQSYKGLSPTLSLTSFSGEVYDAKTEDTLISKSLSDRKLTETLHTGTGAFPTSSSFKTSQYQVSTTIPANVASSSITLKQVNELSGSALLLSNVEVGSILKIQDELLRVERITAPEKTSGNNLLTLKVARGYLTSTVASAAPNVVVNIMPKTQLFTFQGSGSKVTTTRNSKVWVKDSNEILYTDGFGVVYTGSRVS